MTWQEAAHEAVQEILTLPLEDPAANIDALRRHTRENEVGPIDGFRLARIGSWAIHELAARRLPWSVDEQIGLLARKQADYGHENILSLGFTGIAVRASDKYARYEHMTATGSAGEAEPFIDSLRDLVGYGAIALMLIDGTFTQELETKVAA